MAAGKKLAGRTKEAKSGGKLPPTYTQIGGLFSTLMGVCMVGYAITGPSGRNVNTERSPNSLDSATTHTKSIAPVRLEADRWEELATLIRGGDASEVDSFAAELLAVYPLITPSSPVDVLELHLPNELISLLLSLLEDQGEGRPNDPTRWIDFQQPPSNLVEIVVQGVFRRLAKVADTAEGGSDEISGANWWFESRNVDNPVLYHTDVDKPRRCRAKTSACELPVFSTEFHLSDAGGPSVMFHQKRTPLGLDPVLPSCASVVGPHINRLVVYSPSLYHGVLQAPPDGKTLLALSGQYGEAAQLAALKAEKRAGEVPDVSSARKTLRVDYWRKRPVGAKDIPDLPSPAKSTAYMKKGMQMITTHLKLTHEDMTALQRVPLQHLRADYSFDNDLETWQSQNLPAWAALQYAQASRNRRVFMCEYTGIPAESDVDKGQAVTEWKYWTDR